MYKYAQYKSIVKHSFPGLFFLFLFILKLFNTLVHITRAMINVSALPVSTLTITLNISKRYI